MFNNKKPLWSARLGVLAMGISLLLTAGVAEAGVREQAKRMYDRIAGVPPTEDELAEMLQAFSDPASDTQARKAAEVALRSPSFYSVTLKNLFTPWSNEEQTVFADLNDFTATLIGLVRDGEDFRQALYADVLYVGRGVNPPYSPDNNEHYKALERSGANLAEVLEPAQQTYLPAGAAAGVMTTRQGAKAFFVAGTNRAMLRFTMMNFLCHDMEQLQDVTRVPDRIRQDVSRSPGGDSRVFMNNCVGCHAGMDPLAQAFAYYNWTGEEGTEAGRIEYTPGVVQPKYLINADNFRYGYVTPGDRWDNYWREGQNSALGWDTRSEGLPGGGHGASSMGRELANSEAFAQCQVQHIFRTVCLHGPSTPEDVDAVSDMVTEFKDSGYDLRTVFTQAAAYCRGN